MSEQFVVCPGCKTKIPLSEALVSPIEERLRQEKERDLKRLLAESETRLTAQAKKRAEEAVSVELRDLKEDLESKRQAVTASRDRELEFRRQIRAAQEREESQKVEMARQLDSERRRIAEEAVARSVEESQLKERQKDIQLEALKKQVEELSRKLEEGSKQALGEAQEQELEAVLRGAFPGDEVTPVAQGRRGGDVVQTVRDKTGQTAGTILWESKRVKSWSEGWIVKLKENQREAKAQIAVLVSSALPDEVKQFVQRDGVWVSSFASVLPLAAAMRSGLLQLAQSRGLQASRNERAEVVFQYLVGQQFRARLESIVEGFTGMREELDSEKRATQARWARRERHLEKVLSNTAGMYGDVQGLLGPALPEIKALEFDSGTAEGEA